MSVFLALCPSLDMRDLQGMLQNGVWGTLHVEDRNVPNQADMNTPLDTPHGCE